MIDPVSKAQWQEAVDAADVLLALDAAREYGLITGGPMINMERCMKILSQGRNKGIVPSADRILEHAQAQKMLPATREKDGA